MTAPAPLRGTGTGNKMTAARKALPNKRGAIKAVAPIEVQEPTEADALLERAVQDAIVVYRFGRAIGRPIHIAAVAQALERYADEAAALMPVEPMHSGMSWESRRVGL